MAKKKLNNPRPKFNGTSHSPLTQIRKRAEQEARAIPLPDLDTMTREEILQMIHEMQIKQIEARLETEMLHTDLQKKNDILNGISDGVWSLTWPDLDIVYISPATEEIYGRPLQDFYENPSLWQEVVHPEDQHLTREAFEQLQETGAAKRQCRILRPDGSISRVSDKSRLVFDQDNHPVRVDGICRDITKGKQAGGDLQKIEWMLSSQKKHPLAAEHTFEETYDPPYGDLTKLNTSRQILDAVGKETLKNITDDFLDLLETSVAVYERNGDYALGLFSSDWCRFMDQASYRLCKTDDSAQALICGKWFCHESCWNTAKQAIETAKPVDTECGGGIRLYAVPIMASGKVIGTINVGYGDPPTDVNRLSELAIKYGVDVKGLTEFSNTYESRPYFIIELAKRRIRSAALLIGEIVERKRAEESLRQSENYYRAIFETSGSAMFILEEDTTISHVNSNFEKLSGYAKQEVEGKKSWIEFIHADDVGWMKKNHYLRRGDPRTAPLSYEFRFFIRNGDLRHGLLTVNMISETAQSVVSVIDITERKLTEDALRESEEKFRQLFASSPISLWEQDFSAVKKCIDEIKGQDIGDLDSYFRQRPELLWKIAGMVKVLDVNPATLMLYQAKSKEEFFGKITRVFSKESLDGFLPVLKVIAAGEKSFVIEKEHVTLTGKPLKVQLHWRVAEGHEKTYSRVIVSIVDITGQKQAEAALKKEHLRLENIIEGAQVGTWEWNIQTGEVVFNETWAEMVGYSLDELSPVSIRTWEKLAHPDDLKQSEQLIERHIAGELPLYDIEVRMRHKAGHWVWVQDRGKVVQWTKDGQPLMMFGTHQDITQRKRMLEALHKSEEKHRRLFETMAQGVIYQNADGEIISANPAAEKMLGLSLDQMLGKTSMDPGWKMIKEDGSSVPGTEHPVMIALRSGQTVGPVRRGVFHSGKNSHVWLSITAIPLFREGEAAPFQVYATITDITEHLEKELEYSQILNTSIDGFWVVDTRGHFLEVNPAVVGLLGYTREEMLAQRISDIEATESPEEMDQHIKTIKKQGYERFETQHRHKDGHLLDVEVSASFLAHPHERFIVFTRDISERKQKERENHINRLRLEILHEINNMPWATEKMISDLLLEKMLSLSSSEIGFLGYITDDEEVMEIHSWSDKAMQRCAIQDKPMVFPIQQAGLWGEPIRNRKPLIVNDYNQPHSAKQGFPEGHIQISTFMAIPVFEDGSIVAIAGVGNKKWAYDDIDVRQLELLMNQCWEVIRRNRLYNEKSRIEAQLNQAQKMESVGRLAGGVAHDFNNKLSVINGYAELAMEAIDPSDPLQETIQEIFTAGQQSAGIVRQLLAFARKQTITPVLLDLNDTISGLLKMLQRLIGENINLEWHPGNNLWPVKMDPSQIDQIMANLAVNSRDAISDVGKLTIETDNIVADEDYCRGNQEAIPGRYVMLAVTDDGCGIEKEVREQVFDPYFTTKEIGKG
ncbi:MAG: PAS domain S-box protein, partial [Thermodesulfobacteriota bacterium]